MPTSKQNLLALLAILKGTDFSLLHTQAHGENGVLPVPEGNVQLPVHLRKANTLSAAYQSIEFSNKTKLIRYKI